MSGPEVLYAEMTSGNPATLADVRDDLATAMTSIDSSADSLALATTGVVWNGEGRDSYNARIWATKALAEMAHFRCSQGKLALRSVRRAQVQMEEFADIVITWWRTNKQLPLDGPTFAKVRNEAMDHLTRARGKYKNVLVACTDFLPTDDVAQGDEGKGAWEEYLKTGGLSDKEREALAKGLGHSLNFGLQNGTLPGPVIPDTAVTGNDDKWVPQGVGYSPDNGGTVVHVAYGDGDKAVASIVDPDTGELLSTVELGGYHDAEGEYHKPDHVGGVVVDGNDIWVTSGRPSAVIRYSLDDLRNGSVGDDPVTPKDAAPLKEGGHAYSTIHTDRDGTTYLYAGNHWNDRMYRYEKVGDSWVRDEGYEVKTPEYTQGVVVRDGEIVFSTSYARDYESVVQTFDRETLEDGGDAAKGEGEMYGTYLPNMSEGIVETPWGYAVTHESGADKYLGTGHEWVSPFMTVLPPGSGVPGVFEVEPETLRSAAGRVESVETVLAGAAKKIKNLHLPVSALGQVEGASDFAQALNLHLDATGIWLRNSEISAGISIAGLLGSATTHERVDTFWRDVYEQDRERLGIGEKAKELWDDTADERADLKEKAEDVKEKAGEVKDEAGDIYDKATPWDGAFPG